MKVLIVSDTHKRNEGFYRVVEMHKPDLVIHCGDAEGYEEDLAQAAGCPVKIVLGNNDFFSDLPRELEFEVAGYKVWVTHGHHYYVSLGIETIKQEAIARGVDIVCFGHTHRPLLDTTDGVVVVNPGSLSYPRQEGRQRSYVIMELDRFGELHFTIAYLK